MTRTSISMLGGAAAVLMWLPTAGCVTLEEEDATMNRARGRAAAIVAAIPAPSIPDRRINLIEHAGQVPDAAGSVDFRPAVQAALDELAAAGGGTLFFPHPAGADDWRKHEVIYRLNGPILLPSHVELLFDPAVVLEFTFDPQAYLPDGEGVITCYEGCGIITYSGLIRGFNVSDVALRAVTGGNGAPPEIRGSGRQWQEWSWAGQQRVAQEGGEAFYDRIRRANHEDVPLRERRFYDTSIDFFRPTVLEFFLCRTIEVDGIKISGPPFWTVHPVFSENLVFRNMLLDCYGANTDGIDPDACRNVLIENVVFNNQDDNVAIKSGRDRDGREGIDISGTVLEQIDSPFIREGRMRGPTSNVVIRNCVFKGHYAICIGSEMSGGAHDIYAFDNRSVQNVKMGFFIKSGRKRGGTVESVFIDGLRLNTVEKDVICIMPNYDRDAESPWPPTVRDIHLRNVSAAEAKHGIRIFGWPDAPAENISVCSVDIGRVAEQAVVISNAREIVLDDVVIDGRAYEGTRSDTGGDPVPFQN